MKEHREHVADWEYKEVVSYGSKDFQALEKDLNELGKGVGSAFWVEAAGEEEVFLLQKNEDELLEQNSHGSTCCESS